MMFEGVMVQFMECQVFSLHHLYADLGKITKTEYFITYLYCENGLDLYATLTAVFFFGWDVPWTD